MLTSTQRKWVLIKQASQQTGYTPAAIRTKLRRGVWKEGKHWVKAPDNRIFINLVEVEGWVTNGDR